MAVEWFYQAKGQQFGPIPAAELLRLAEAGIVTSDTPVRKGTDGRWVHADKVQGLLKRNVLPLQMAVRQIEDKPIDSAASSSPERELPPPVPPRTSISIQLNRVIELPPNVPSRSLTVLLGSLLRKWGWLLVALAACVVVVGLLVSIGMRSDEPSASPEAEKAASPPIVSRSDNSIYEISVPSVLIIRSFRGEKEICFGSGFVLNPGDCIVTNEHVIRGASVVRIKTFGGKCFEVKDISAVDVDRDIAILPMPSALIDSRGLMLATDPPKVGDSVFALGAPYGLDFTFTKGVVSQFRRDFDQFGSVVQTDASVSPGSSGGPLIDSYGRVVGINTLASAASVEAHNLNFAVSAEEIAAVCKCKTPCRLVDLDGYHEYESQVKVAIEENDGAGLYAERGWQVEEEEVIAAWQQMRDGMTPDEVESLLGKASDEWSPETWVPRLNGLSKATLNTVMVWDYEYRLGLFDHQGYVEFHRDDVSSSRNWRAAEWKDPTKWGEAARIRTYTPRPIRMYSRPHSVESKEVESKEDILAAWQKLRKGMSPDDVESLLGNSQHSRQRREDNFERMIWEYSYSSELFPHQGCIEFRKKSVSPSQKTARRKLPSRRTTNPQVSDWKLSEWKDPTKWTDPAKWLH